MRTLPRLVAQLTQLHDAWLVGSSAVENTPRDYDVLVPFMHWPQAALLIPLNATPNTFGGWKCQSDGVIVDVWPGDLAQLLALGKTKTILHPRTNQLFHV